MKTMTIEEYRTAMKEQGAKDPAEIVFVCPMCGTLQCANDFIRAGAGRTLADVQPSIGFSCIGRFIGAGSPRKKPDGKPCNWTLGGFLQMHNLEVVTPDGEIYPRFEVASPEEARKHLAK